MVGLIFLTFFVISFLTNIIGPLVPEIIDDFDLSLTFVAVLEMVRRDNAALRPSGMLVLPAPERPGDRLGSVSSALERLLGDRKATR